MHLPTTTWDLVLAGLLLGWFVAMWVAIGVLAVGNKREVRPWSYRLAAGVIGVGLIGQLGHVQEHVAQVIYWLWHPNEPGWMTPLGDSLSRGFGTFVNGTPMLGMEVLHLAGNGIFLAGLVGVMLITSRALQTKTRKWAKIGVIMQGLHGVEHLVLTLSVAFGQNAVGLSTWFGLLESGPGLWTHRVWWHFVANVVGTVIFAIAVRHLWRERRLIETSYRQHETLATERAGTEHAEAEHAGTAAAVSEPAGTEAGTEPGDRTLTTV